MKSLVSALNAIETADENADVMPLFEYIKSQGIPYAVAEELVATPGSCDSGRVSVALQRLEQPEQPEQPKEATDGEVSETSDDGNDTPTTDTDADDVS